MPKWVEFCEGRSKYLVNLDKVVWIKLQRDGALVFHFEDDTHLEGLPDDEMFGPSVFASMRYVVTKGKDFYEALKKELVVSIEGYPSQEEEEEEGGLEVPS